MQKLLQLGSSAEGALWNGCFGNPCGVGRVNVVEETRVGAEQGAALGEEGGREVGSSRWAPGWGSVSTMRSQIDLLATVTVLGVLEQGKCPLYVWWY